MDKLIVGILAVVVILAIGSFGYSFYGYLTQHESLAIEVIDKQVDVNTSMTCIRFDEDGYCRQYTETVTKSYIIASPTEVFQTSESLYYQLQPGKKHHINVAGWNGSYSRRYITQVLE